MCGAVDETEQHLFFECEFSRVLWYCCSLQLDMVQHELLHECVFVMWRNWKSRNEMVFKGFLVNPMEMVNLARNGASFAGQLVRWKRPPYGVLKINCDGAWCGKTRKGGYGWVLRDFAGLLQTASGERGLFFNTDAMAEAAAIRVALLVCIELGCEEVEVESDSQVIIQMLNGEYVIDATLECFIHAIGLLVSQLGRVRFMFFKQNGSVAAHAVASYVASHRGAFRWNVFGPEFLFNILTKDVKVSIRI
ncbi:unnamed protein product [Malus baccata var. baccata]